MPPVRCARPSWLLPNSKLARRCLRWCWQSGFAALFAGYAAAQSTPPTTPPKPAPESAEVTTPEVEVSAPRFITPLPGIVIDREQTTTNVQSATGKEIAASKSVSLTDYMNRTMQSVNVNDYTGNPFQQDLTFRGFSASPQIGTPQGLSVYLDGVRVNEPFGEVVNWDLIPMNAIRRMDLIPGSNPLFGLNTLGGALSLTTKSGFTDPGVEASLMGGSWGRRQLQASIGGNDGSLGGFLALNGFNEDGWRINSPTSIRQIFTNIGARWSSGEVWGTFMYADNSLVGNGLVPLEIYQQQPTAVFTSPDETTNRMWQGTLGGRLDLSQTTSLSGMVYQRHLNQQSASGDFYDEWPSAANGRTGPCPAPYSTNSTYPDGAAEVNATGCPGVTPNGVFNYGQTEETARGASVQFTWATDKHQIVVGTAYDTNNLTFSQDQRLGWIGANGTVYLDPASYDTVGLVPLIAPIHRNSLQGGSDTTSLFMLGVWAVKPNLSLTAGGRYSYSRVQNTLVSDRPIPLYQFNTTFVNKLQERCGAETDPLARYLCSSGDFTYAAFNPYLGFSYLPVPSLNWYGNASRGNRVPSAIELGCARDHSADLSQNNGKLVGCSIPTSLTSDPYLPQVRSTSFETGLRGTFGPTNISWNAGIFRTDLTNDILFVSTGSFNRGVFDSFAKTRRQGVELGIGGALWRSTFSASYSYIDATFQSTADIVNPANSSSDHAQGAVNSFTVEPGDRIPGIPQHSLRLNWDLAVTQRWNVGLSMIASSWSYAQGNQNNQATPGGTSSDGSLQVDRQGNVVVDPGQTYLATGKIPGYAIFNFITSFRMNRDWTMFMRIDNVFDRSYQTAADLGLNPFTPSSRYPGIRDASGFNYNSNNWTYSNFVGPGAPRGIWVGVSYSFTPSGGKWN
jgi:iron complex outermembrane recepter protein